MDSDSDDDREENGGVNDWCLVCKEGGEVIECETGGCGRVYHTNCLRPIPASLENWQCARHSCYDCKRSPPVAVCYSCPKASCSECLSSLGFVRVHGEYGFCPHCWDLAKYVEGLTKAKPKMDPEEYGLFQHCKEYYWIVKEHYRFTRDKLVAVKKNLREMRGERRGRRKHRSDDDKVFQKKKKKKLNSAGSSQKEVVRRDTRILVPALTHQNVRRIYLTRKVVQNLLMEPDTFEEKVRRAFVGIELPRKPGSNRTDRQLVQITGITKTLQNNEICIKLQAKDRQDDISVDMVSDMDFLEIVCQHLRQQVKDGLIEMPDVEEFKRMAKVLSEVLVDDFIVRDTRRLQKKMDFANEKGRREEFLLLAQEKRDLQTYTKKLQLINYFQQVDVEQVSADTLPGKDKVDSDDIMDGKKQKDPPKLLQQDSPALGLKRDKNSVGRGSKQHGMKWTKDRQVVDGKKPAEETMLINAADDMLITTDHMLITADHSNVQSSMVEMECDVLLLSRDVLVEQKRTDVMLEEFENNCRVVKEEKQLVVLSTEGSSVPARLGSLEQKVNRILEHLETTEDGAKKRG